MHCMLFILIFMQRTQQRTGSKLPNTLRHQIARASSIVTILPIKCWWSDHNMLVTALACLVWFTSM